MAPKLPMNWVIFTVANIYGDYRPLDISVLNPKSNRLDEGSVIRLIQRAVTYFEDPTSRLALASEISLAAIFYKNRISAHRNLPWALHTFPLSYLLLSPVLCPFVTTCLTQSRIVCSGFNLTSIAFDYVFHHENPCFAMAVIDITNTEKIRYGIVAQDMQNIEEFPTAKHLDKFSQLRDRPLSAKKFAEAFGIQHVEAELGKLDGYSVISPEVLDCVWPTSLNPARDGSYPPRLAGPKSLLDLALVKLIDHICRTPDFDWNSLDEIRPFPWFQGHLRRGIECNGLHGDSSAVAQLLAMAFEGKTHLDLVKCRGVSATGLGKALEMAELKDIVSISIYAESHSIEACEEFAAVMSSCPKKYDLYICELPCSIHNRPSMLYYQELCRDKSRLERTVFVTGVYSAALQKKRWTSMIETSIPELDFPLQYIYCQYFYGDHIESLYCYTREALISPQRAVGGLLRFLLEDEGARECHYTSLTPTYDNLDRLPVNPLPVVNFMGECGDERYIMTRNSWHILVKRDMKADEQTLFVHYAFVKLTRDIDPKDYEKLMQEPSLVEVHTMQSFLEAMTGKALDESDARLIDQHMEDINATLNARRNTVKRRAMPMRRETAKATFSYLVEDVAEDWESAESRR
ncbi:hypothetical protein GGS21DRAFT_543161 [Xylaria nigripes]|nr:hypothetical protein GGS21DRAFT_543161 [Xylaria nigripes]